MPVYQPGELLYLSFKAKKYTRPPIRITTDPNNIFSAYLNNPNFMGYSKLCDIELTFLATRRAYPNQGESPPIPNNFTHCRRPQSHASHEPRPALPLRPNRLGGSRRRQLPAQR